MQGIDFTQKKWLGLKVGLMSLLIVVFGFLYYAFYPGLVAKVVFVVGVLGGLVGISIHFAYMLLGMDETKGSQQYYSKLTDEMRDKEEA